ncbi:nose resistant to fluoxetine protein 6 [Ixodes scapularis]|uniref:nose resistant to fluoxetine protein 6 n=1 Tax=Ixodes scapularis TaxID=6945 RepID=UPI001C3844AF|nr:nose resistant to fluoxetine protein 6 [Ixodes scapularis]
MYWLCSAAFAVTLLSNLLAGTFGQEEETVTRSLESDIEDVLGLLMKNILPIVSGLAFSPKLGSACSSDLFKIISAVQKRDPWVIRMILSNGLLPSNLLEGSLLSLGGYEQCLKTRMYGSDGELRFKGQYCTVFIEPRQSMLESFVHHFQAAGELLGRFDPIKITTDTNLAKKALRLGTCTPSSCSAEEIHLLANGLLRIYGTNATVKGCRTDDPKRVTFLQLVSIANLEEYMLGAFFGPLKLVLIFSAINNTRRLLRTETRADNKPILFLSGVKVLLILWVIYGHVYVVVQPEFTRSPFFMLELTNKVLFQVVVNALLSVSTFLFLSGFVTTFLMLGHRDLLKKRFLIPVYVIGALRRYFRLTLPIVVVVLAAFLLPLLADGPADQELMAQQVGSCADRWWTVLLHYNNFNAIHEMCLIHLWYVSTDMQIFMVVAFPLTLLFIRYPKFALLVSGILMLGFSIMTSLQTHSWHLLYSGTSGTNDGVRILETLRYIYFRPFAHVATYVLGAVTGYVTINSGKAKIHPIVRAALWLISLGLTTSVMFITFRWNRGQLPNEIANALYGGFHRFFWSLGLAWPAYACATGRGGILNGFLSWTAFMPLSRLTYCIYLVHLLFILLRVGSMKTHTYIAEYFQVTTALGVFCISVFFAYLLHLGCEAPVLQIEKLIFDKPMKSLTTDKKPPVVSEVLHEKSQL